MSTRLLKNTAFALFGAACFMAGCSRERPSFRFAELPISYSAVTHIAEEQGFFKAQGLNYFAVSVPAGPDVVAVLRNTGPSGATAGGIAVTPVITMIGAGAHPVVLATILDSDEQVQVVTFSRTGITKDANSLRGKRMGVVRNTVGDIYLSRWLAQTGLSEKDLTVVDGRPGDLRSLLADGALDAAILWDPFVSQSIRRYQDVIAKNPSADRGAPTIIVDSTLYHLAFNVVTTKEQLETHRPEILSLLRAVVSGGDYINADPRRSQMLLSQWLKIDTGDLDHFMSTSKFAVHLDVPKMKAWMRTELDWLLTKDPKSLNPDDFSPFIDSTLLKAVNPALVAEK